MARVTVEDCVERIPNRFELVMCAAQRARNITAGAELTVDRDNDKNPVVALREIAEKMATVEELQEALIKGQQRVADIEEFGEEEELELVEALQEEREAPSIKEEVLADALSITDDAAETEAAGTVEVVAEKTETAVEEFDEDA